MPPVICNTTPLVALWAIRRLPLLKELFGEVLIPPAVAEEFVAIETITRQTALREAAWITIRPLGQPTYALTFSQLDQGEAEVLALAIETQAQLVVIDEASARRQAERLKLPLTGTLGVLLLAKEQRLINAIQPEITKLLEAGLYMSQELVLATLKLAGEDGDNEA